MCLYSSDIEKNLEEQVKFYQKLFTSEGWNEQEAEKLLMNVDARLTEAENLDCDKIPTEEEILKVIKTLKKNMEQKGGIIIFLDQQKAFDRVEWVLECYEKASGARINKKKTKGMYIGSWKQRPPNYMEISWVTDNIKVLGIYMGYNIDKKRDEFKRVLAEAENKLVVVDFQASWCQPCRTIGPVFKEMAESKVFEDLVFCEVDVDEAADVAEEYEVQMMPAFMFFKKGEKIRMVLGTNVNKLKASIEELM
ncbi:uncharacterized protein LOC132560148 [Ylistrum balloti]|uniref:uncharacterized protein LOC132560148 n=1 Tax=Ylistrum balloti TaxID=509963 RepID=UPI002905DDCF|nr:uncharacterized protein LOC132560148 [Ylistrum balloti]